MADMLEDRTFSAHHTIGGLFWITGGVILIAFMTTEQTGLGALGVFLGLIGGTVNIRGFFSEYAHRMDNAYEIGRDAGGGRLRQM